MECAHITVRGFNAHYNKWVTFTNLKLEVEGLYQIIQNENILESLFCLCLLISALRFSKIIAWKVFFFTIMHFLKVGDVLVWAGSVRKMSTSAF